MAPLAAPLIGGVAQIPIMYLVVKNSGTLGGSVWMMDNILWIMIAIFVAGMVLALIYRQAAPKRYSAIGRYLHEDA